jgi:hypothetical protein
MRHQLDPDPEQAVRALLTTATDDPPPTTDLLRKVRRHGRSRRRRALVPSLASVAVAGLAAAVALAASTITGAPSVQAQVAAAVTLTGQDSYRVRLTSASTKSDGAAVTTEAVYDPVRRSGRLVGEDGNEVLVVDGVVYRPVPADQAAENGLPEGTRWIASNQAVPGRTDREADDFSELAGLTDEALFDPQHALERVRSAGGVREQGRASGEGWVGTRFAFELTDRGWLAVGTIDIDDGGRVRRLDLRVRPPAGANWASGKVVMEFSDFGIDVSVTAPPANQVLRDPPDDSEARRVRGR